MSEQNPMPDNLADLDKHLSQVWEKRKFPEKSDDFPLVYAGIETRTNPKDYYWDGLKRAKHGLRSHVVFQYTLRGYGAFLENDRVQWVNEGQFFYATIPSSHAYFLPKESTEWRFFWFIIMHPYVVARISNRSQATIGPVCELSPASPLVSDSIKLFELLCLKPQRSSLDEEKHLFDFLISFEKFRFRRFDSSNDPGASLMRQMKQAVFSDLKRPFNVEEFAAKCRMSRSYFTQVFLKKTGMSPAMYVRKIRLIEAERLLLNSNAVLNKIAEETGFANATHFCKVFRQHYGVSPSVFRRQRNASS